MRHSRTLALCQYLSMVRDYVYARISSDREGLAPEPSGGQSAGRRYSVVCCALTQEEADLDAVLDYGLDFCGDDAHARGGDHGDVRRARRPSHGVPSETVFLLVASVQAHI